MCRTRLLAAWFALLPAVVGASVDKSEQEFKQTVTPMLKQFCYECHGDGASAGELALDAFKSVAEIRAAKPTFQKVIRYLRGHTMPSPDATMQPTQPQRDALTKALSRVLYDFDPDRPDPGRVTIRRLNRAEYRNVIRDLTGVTFDPTIDFPQDDTGYGFDNIADVLTLPPMLMEKYLAAAEKILEEAIPERQTESRQRRVAAVDAKAGFDREGRIRDGWVQLSSAAEDALAVINETDVPAELRVRVLAYADYPQAPPIGLTEHPPMKLSLMIGDTVVRDVELTNDQSQPKWFEARVGVPAGRHAFRAAVRRIRGAAADRNVTVGHVGLEQPGFVYVKEFLVDGPLDGAVRRIDGNGMELGGKAGRMDTDIVLGQDGDEAIAPLRVERAGKYLLRMRAYSQHAGSEPAKVELLLDGVALKTLAIDAPAPRQGSTADKQLDERARRGVPQVYEVEATLSAGKHRLTARFINDLWDPQNADPNFRDRNVIVQHFEAVELAAPAGSAPMPEPMAALFAKFPKADDARGLLERFTYRARRRPPRADEIDRLMQLYKLARDNGQDHHAAVRHSMKAVLVSLSFLFQGEVEPPQNLHAEAYSIGEFELASRLSFFLWSTMPDDELLELAKQSQLRAQLEPQVKRMLASAKAQAFVDNFAGQWLQFRNLDAAHPDPKKFEEYDDQLRDSMRHETRMFFGSILREDRSILDVLVGDYTFVNETLAKHYGIENVKGNQFRRVSLAGTPRRGVLTQGSVLTLTSNPTRTSPVKRGKWVLENLLGVAPPPPPPDIPPLVAEGKKMTGTLRQQLEMHRADPVCASCHAPMDPIGLGLENFNAIGRWREKDGDSAIDASAAFADGAKFNGPSELVKLLAETRRGDFFRAATEAAMTFALGRGVEPFDEPAVDKIVDELHKTNGRFSSLVMGVINSAPFQMRRAEPAPALQGNASVGGAP